MAFSSFGRPGLALLLLLGSGVIAMAGAAVAQEASYSPYERDVIDEVTAAVGASLEPAPDGKVVEEILVYRLKVFDHRDPVPKFVNVLHRTSREHVIRRELLFAAGEPYDSARVSESARNLRDIIQVSLVLVLPLRGSTPDRVRVVVVTKDIWSLRAAWDPEITSQGFIGMSAAADEINVAGRHKTVSLRGGFDQGMYYYGAGYADPRVAGSRIQSSTSAALVFDRDTGDPEGSFGWVWYGQDLYSLETKWGWGTFVAWREDVERTYVGVEQRAFDAKVTPEDDALPFEWDREVWYGTNEVVRSWGRQHKLDVAVGLEVLRTRYALPLALTSNPAVSSAARDELRREEVPPDHDRLGPFVEVRARSTAFLRTLDLDTLALQEDIQTGHDVSLRVYPATSAVAARHELCGVAATAAYTLPVGDGLVRGVATAVTELAGPRTDALVEGRLFVVSPRLGFGRIVYDADVAHRYRDYYKERFVLGGIDRLRGYPTSFRRGRDLVAGTLELRTTSVGLLGVELGAAAFYDVGDAADGFAALDLQQSIGGGARLLFPMFDRTVFRVDVGVPLDRDHREPATPPWGFAAGFAQAVPLPRTTRSRTPAALGIR